jgi:DNA polymerase-3 subunit chi
VIVDFYHLDQSPLERVLPRICERVLEQGQRLLIVTAADDIPGLDEHLWRYARESFLPHGAVDSSDASRQPILLSSEPHPLNGARNIALADGQWRTEALNFERAFLFFDGARIGEARESWSSLKNADGVERRYWQQDAGGKWVQGP